MKIGLLTVYYANYGSFYQAASLARQLRMMGHECEIINASIRGKYSIKYLMGVMGDMILPECIVRRIANRVIPLKTYRALKPSFRKEGVGGIVFSAKQLNKRYDCIIVGSDELWSSTLSIMHYIPVYFGAGLNIPHISFSTSAVSLHCPDSRIESEMCTNINTFSALSVRDIETQQWIQKWTGKIVPITLDPTLMNPFFGSEGRGGGGLIVYGEHFQEEHIRLIRSYAKRHNMRIHALCWPLDWCDDFIDVISPEQLQKVFSDADFCAVSTFHGTVFSLLHKRPFAAFCAPNRTTKIKNLLKQVGMTQCFWDECRTQDIEFKGDYDFFNSAITLQRKESLSYLENALSNVEGEIADEKRPGR